jgi:chromate transport protein ChrA
MANPDGTGASSNMGGIMTLGFFVAILVIILFNYEHLSMFNGLLYGILPIVIYLLMVLVIYISKSNTTTLGALSSAVPTIGATYLALFISYISYFRIPIASVIAPLFLDSSANIVSQPAQKGGAKKQKGGACCSPTYSLEGVELQFPSIKGISYGFYLFFAVCFGGVAGLSSASS